MSPSRRSRAATLLNILTSIWHTKVPTARFVHMRVRAVLESPSPRKVEAAYQRTDLFERRRRLMADWEAYLAGRRAVSGAAR